MKKGPTIKPHKKGGFYTTYRKKFIYGSSEQAVMDKYIEARSLDAQGIDIKQNPLTKDYAIWWFNLYKKGKGSINTQKMYANIVNNHVIPALGEQRIKGVRTSDVQELLNATASSASLQQKVRITLNQIFNKAIADRLILVNPVIGTDPVETPEPIRACYTPEQRNILIELFHESKIFPLLFTILNTGLRATEAIALMKNRDIDLKNNRIRVRESTEFDKSQPQKAKTKTERSVRVVPIPSAFADWMGSYLKTQKSLYVFPGAQGGQMGLTMLKSRQKQANTKIENWLSNAEAAFEKRKRKDGLTDKEREMLRLFDPLLENTPDGEDYHFRLHFKTLRHTYCTELFDLGIDEVSAAKIMGHTVSVMREIYTHIQKGRQQQTIDKIEGLYQNNLIKFPQKRESK